MVGNLSSLRRKAAAYGEETVRTDCGKAVLYRQRGNQVAMAANLEANVSWVKDSHGSAVLGTPQTRLLYS
jgi:hypothetical protein